MSSLRSKFRDVWLMPLVLAVLTLFGLLTALLGPDTWRWIAWLCIATPIAAVFLSLWFRRR